MLARGAIGRVAAAIACAVAIADSPAVAKPPEVEELRPYTPWHVDWAERTCVMRRGFGSAADPLVLQIERFGPTNHFQLLLTGKRLRGMAPPRPISVGYGQGGHVHTLDNYAVGATKARITTIFIIVSALRRSSEGQPPLIVPVTPDQEEAITEISISRIRGKEFVLKTGSLGPVFLAMRKCTDQLIEFWGLNPTQQLRLTRPATPKDNPGSWLHSSDYPSAALTSGMQAIVNFRLTVDETGMPAACELQRSYSGELFDRTTCQLLMRRARFDPALDSDGKPIRSFFLNTVRWMIP